jgi:hypothetical protein
MLNSVSKKSMIDNKARFRYLDDYSIRLIKASIGCAAVEAGTQFTIFA